MEQGPIPGPCLTSSIRLCPTPEPRGRWGPRPSGETYPTEPLTLSRKLSQDPPGDPSSSPSSQSSRQAAEPRRHVPKGGTDHVARGPLSRRLRPEGLPQAASAPSTPESSWKPPCESGLRNHPAVTFTITKARPIFQDHRSGCGIACRAQPLPSGSLKKTKLPQGNTSTLLTSTPRSASSSRPAREIASIPVDGDRDRIVEEAVGGSVVFEAAFTALRRLAEAHHSAIRFG